MSALAEILVLPHAPDLIVGSTYLNEFVPEFCLQVVSSTHLRLISVI